MGETERCCSEDQREETRMMRERESDGRMPRRQYKIDILYGRV